MNKYILIDEELSVLYTDALTEDHVFRATAPQQELVILDVSDPNNLLELGVWSGKFHPITSEEEDIEQQRKIDEECDFGLGAPCSIG